jgi:hypothetical protein
MVLENPNQLFLVFWQEQGTHHPFGQGGESLIRGSKNRNRTFAPQLIGQVSRIECHDQRFQLSNTSHLFDKVICFCMCRPEADRCHGQREKPPVLKHFRPFNIFSDRSSSQGVNPSTLDLSRRSGRFPALPYPPLETIPIYSIRIAHATTSFFLQNFSLQDNNPTIFGVMISLDCRWVSKAPAAFYDK